MSVSQQYVWYASYGSNINSERFLCYIKGGSPRGSTRIEVGCHDSSLPINETTMSIPHPLYFAKEAAGWQSQGVAFIGLKRNSTNMTYSKKYLITIEQFLDVVKQENNGINISINLDEVKQNWSKTFRKNSWYGTVLYLGEDQGYPIFTFTAPWDITDVDWKKPSHNYLSTIFNGLKEDYSKDDIYHYFRIKPGIKGEYSDEELLSLLD